MVATNKKIFLILFCFVIALTIFILNSKTSTVENTLKIYSYSSFSNKSGAGPALARIFEKNNNIKISFINSDSALVMFTKMKQDKGGVDLFIGLDQFNKKNALKEIGWKATNLKFDESFFNIFSPGNYLVPYNWSPMTFIYRKGEVKPPTGWQDIADNEYKISVPDPRTSSPGNVFLYWLSASFKQKFDLAGTKLRKKITNWAPSWSSSYGMFSNKNTNLTFSYLTSVAYHLQNGDENYKPASFNTGHPYHIEYVGVPDSCSNCALAQKFIELMLSDKGQKIIMEKNVMFPVKKNVINNTVFAKLPKLSLLPLSGVDKYNLNKESIINNWKKIFRESE